VSRADLVTGAGGFVGSHLARALAADGRTVRALDVDLRRLDGGGGAPVGVEPIEADLGDAAARRRALEGVDAVYHLAAAHLSVTAPEAEYRRVNVDATEALARGAAAAGARRFVHVSTVGVYGPLDDPPADEETPCRPELLYERTKLEGERAVRRVAAEVGLEAVVLRPVWIYGPGCGRTEKLLRAVARGRFPLAGRGDKLRHCLFVDDAVESLRRAARSPSAAGGVFVVGDDRAVTVRELLDTAARLQGAPPPRRLPLALFAVAATAVELLFRTAGREPPVSRRSLRFFTGNTAFDVTRAREVLGWKPRYDLEPGLRETLRRLGGGVV